MTYIIKYDAEADVLTVKLKEGALADEEMLDVDAIVCCDKFGKLVSLEILDASKKGLLTLSWSSQNLRKKPQSLCFLK